jgi:hypothetical protein
MKQPPEEKPGISGYLLGIMLATVFSFLFGLVIGALFL